MYLSWRLGTFACLLLSLHVLARPGDDDKASISSGEYFMSQTSSQDRREGKSEVLSLSSRIPKYMELTKITEAATQAAEGSHNAAPAAAGGSPAPRGSFSPTSSDDRNFGRLDRCQQWPALMRKGL